MPRSVEHYKQGKASLDLRLLGAALCKELTIYDQIENGEIPLLPGTRKSLYASINELCVTIIKKVDNLD